MKRVLIVLLLGLMVSVQGLSAHSAEAWDNHKIVDIPYSINTVYNYYSDNYGIRITSSSVDDVDVMVLIIPDSPYLTLERAGLVSQIVFYTGYPNPQLLEEREFTYLPGVHIIDLPIDTDYVIMHLIYNMAGTPPSEHGSWFVSQFQMGDTTIAFDFYFNEGYQSGLDYGYDLGYSDGYIDGGQATEQQAYNQGYNDGLLADVDMGFFQAILTGMSSILALQIFGSITIGALIAIPLSFAFLRWFIRMLGGS